MQVLTAFDPRLVGAQASAVGVAEATRLIVAVCETLLNVAVIVALELVVRELVVTVKLADIEPAFIENEAGTARTALLLDTVTEDPPVGAV